MLFLAAGLWLLPNLDAGSRAYQIVSFISMPRHFSQDFCRGLVDTRHVVLYGSVALFSLFLTVRIWRLDDGAEVLDPTTCGGFASISSCSWLD